MDKMETFKETDENTPKYISIYEMREDKPRTLDTGRPKLDTQEVIM